MASGVEIVRDRGTVHDPARTCALRPLCVPGGGALRSARFPDIGDNAWRLHRARIVPALPHGRVDQELGALLRSSVEVALGVVISTQPLEYFPAPERAFDYSTSKTALILLTGYQTPATLRRIGRTRLATWLKNHGVRTVAIATSAAQAAVTAAGAQHTAVPGEKTAATMTHTLSREVIALDEKIDQFNALIEDRFREHPDAEVITSMPGIGDMLGAEFIAATGGDMSAFGSPDRLAGVAGLAPVPRDSGKVSGNLQRPRRYSRRLLRMFYLSAQVAAIHCPESQRFYQRKRTEGKSHKQAVLALARRRLNVLWALIRDHRTFEAAIGQPATTAA